MKEISPFKRRVSYNTKHVEGGCFEFYFGSALKRDTSYIWSACIDICTAKMGYRVTVISGFQMGKNVCIRYSLCVFMKLIKIVFAIA